LSAGRRLLVRIAVPLLKLWFSTCRVRFVGKPYHDAYILGERSIVGATWHRYTIFLVWFFRLQHPMILFSRSRDGELIARFAERLGVVPVRGSSSRGGSAAFREMLQFLAGPGPRKVATVLDGPRGPRFVAKKGMILLACKTGLPLVPFVMSARPALTLKKTWDRTLIPLPFSRVVVLYGKPWTPVGQVSKNTLESLREEVESTLNRMREAADRIAGRTD
jgi:lysophospholipid acyltransferase (LPLAT)-like uncharacterized protein